MVSDRNKELIKNTLLFTVSNFASKILVFLMVPLYTAVLTPQDFGVCDLITTTVSLLMPFLTLCIADSVLRFTLEQKENAKFAFSLGLKICLIGTAITVMVVPVIDQFLDLGVFSLYIPLLFLVNTISGLMIKMARGIDKVKESVIAGVLQTVTIVTVNLILLLWFKWGIIGYLLSFIFGGVVLTAYLSYKCQIWKYIYNVKLNAAAGEYIKYSTPLVPNSLSWWLVDSSSKYILQYFIGFSAIGLFAAANRVPSIIVVISGIFMEAWLLSVIKEYKSDDSKEYIRNVYKLYSFVMIMISQIIIVLSYPISRILLQGDFLEGWKYMPILICAPLFGGLSGFLGTVYSAEKKTKHYFISTLVGGVITLTVGVVLTMRWQIYGVAIACVLGNITIWLIRLATTHKFVDLHLNYYREALNFLILGVTVILTIHGCVWGAVVSILTYGILNYKQGIVFIKKCYGVSTIIKSYLPI